MAYVRTAFLLSWTLLAGAAVGADLPLSVTTLAEDLDGAVGGVTVDALGNVFVADFGDKVWKISAWGDVEVFARGLYGSSGNAIDGEGNLLQSSFFGNTVSRISRDGTISPFASGLSGPVGVAVAKDGTVYVCNCTSNTISKISPERERTDLAVGEPLNCPNGIALDGDEIPHVVNFSDGRMIRIDTDGEMKVLATLPGGGNGHIAWVGPEFYATGFRAGMVFRVLADGTVTPVAGSGRFGDVDGVGLEAGFSTPNGLAYDRTRDILYTNDYLIPWAERFTGRTRPVSTLRRIAFPSLQEAAASAFELDDIEASKAALRNYREARATRANELRLNILGYQRLQAGDVAAAVTVFELNAEFHPESANAWDSLAEGHKVAGRRDEAIKFYQRSLELNPENTNATAMLEELGAE